MPLRFVGGGAYNFNQHQMELTAECHAAATLPPGEYPYCRLGQEDEWASLPIWNQAVVFQSSYA